MRMTEKAFERKIAKPKEHLLIPNGIVRTAAVFKIFGGHETKNLWEKAPWLVNNIQLSLSLIFGNELAE